MAITIADELELLVRAEHADPHKLLGPHVDGTRTRWRALRPHAEAMWLVRGGERKAMKRVHDGGLFELSLEGDARPAPDSYQLEQERDGERSRFFDPYAFWATLGELDLHLVGEGKHYDLHRWLGAHAREHEGVKGTAFAVWAPAARRVSVVGDFNDWDGRVHAMRRLGPGIWEIFIPEAHEGALYKLELLTDAGEVIIKADPLGQAMELRPSNASRVWRSRHDWQDEAWMKARNAGEPARRPMAIYEVHLGSWRQHPGAPRHADRPNWLSYRELAEQLVDYVADLGFTHVELLPVMEHPFDGSWGYQVGGYYAPTSRYGTPDDFRFFVDRCHQKGIGVLVDWVPAHFPKDAFGLGRFDGTALYEHLDPRQGEHKQWGTYVFNYGRNEVRNFLVGNALYWIEEFHIDGLRCDAVASMLYLDYAAQHPGEWVPNRFGGHENLDAVAFLRELNDVVSARHPGVVMVAEESTAWPGVTHSTASGGLGFALKWNMGWMHDTLEYFTLDSIHRSFHHNRITFGLWYAWTERFVLPLSHDEVVHLKKSLLCKMAGDRWRMFANLRALYAHMWAHPGKKLLFMGGELGVWREWSEAEALDWALLSDAQHAGVQRLLRDLNRLYRQIPALWRADDDPRGFRWIDCNDNQQSVVSFVRFAAGDEGEDADAQPYVVCVGNFTPVPRHGYRVGVPRKVRHLERINTDASDYGGSGMGNYGSVEPSSEPAHGFEQSLLLTLPPLSVLWLVPEA